MTIEERVEKLEEELVKAKGNIHRLIMVIALVLGIFTVFVAFRAMTGVAYSQAGKRVEEIIRAKSFVVVDEQGKPRVIMSMDKDGPGLFLYDDKGKSRASLTVFKDCPALSLSDEKGTNRAMLSMFNSIAPRLTLLDAEGTPRASLGVPESGPGLTLYDEKNPRVILSVRKDMLGLKDKPGLTLYDEKGNVIWSNL